MTAQARAETVRSAPDSVEETKESGSVRMRFKEVLPLIGCAMLFSGAAPVRFSYRVVEEFPHDVSAFTQGLIFNQEQLYEGTGMPKLSGVRRVDLATGRVQVSRRTPGGEFGEGIVVWKDRLLQLTYRANRGNIYDLRTLKHTGTFDHSFLKEGWGLTTDGRQLIMSEGSDKLFFVDPETLKVTSTLYVGSEGKAVSGLNELEYIEGEIWANVFPTRAVVRISPRNGNVLGTIDFAGLSEGKGLEMNGIAYDAKRRRIFVTGKYWPKLYEIKLTNQK
jgi:glutaminyl-peptide cyclotransferase